MKIQVDRNISELYLGKWFFSYYLDYRLTITSQKNIMQIKLYDILRKENCSLKLISISEFYLSLWMESSWGAYKIKIYPKKNGKIGVEFFDNDIYKKCRKKPTIEEKQTLWFWLMIFIYETITDYGQLQINVNISELNHYKTGHPYLCIQTLATLGTQ